MLTNTFIHAPGVGQRTESHLWGQGVLTWEDFLAQEDSLQIPAVQRFHLGETVRDSQSALAGRDPGYFARVIPSGETWRAFPEFARTAAYLDIETTGDTSADSITVIGLYDGRQTHTFVQGRDLHEFPAVVARYDLLVTFFGKCFDIPMLRRAFPQVAFERFIHVDLCFALRRLGLRGGLKEIERHLGIRRSRETTGLGGADAVRLWQQYRAGSPSALQLLVRYNAEDVVNLEPLMGFAYDHLRARLMCPRQTA